MNFLLKPDDDRKYFYGPYHTCPEKFQFMIGDKHLLEDLVKLVTSKSLDFWKLFVSNTIQKKARVGNVGPLTSFVKHS